MTPIFWMRWTVRVLLLVLVVAVALTLFTATRVWVVSREDDRSPADVIVVLGAAQFDGTPSPVLESRLMHARTLHDDGVAPVVMTVGGNQPGDRYTEAGVGKDWLVEAGVPAREVVAVPRGEDTWSSLQAAVEAMARRGLSSAVVVTDPAHSLRARTMARDLGIEAWTSPARYNSSRARSGNGARYLLRETGAYLDYVVFGRRGVESVLG